MNISEPVAEYDNNISFDQLRECYTGKLISLLSVCYEYDGLQLYSNPKNTQQEQQQHVKFRKEHI